MQVSTVEHFLRDLDRAHDAILKKGLDVEPWQIVEGVLSLYRTSWLRRRKAKHRQKRIGGGLNAPS